MYSYNISFTCAFITYNTQYCSNLHGWYYFYKGPTLSSERSSVPNPDLRKPEHILILYFMHLCVKIDMHDLMYTCDVHINQKIELIAIHGINFPNDARYSC